MTDIPEYEFIYPLAFSVGCGNVTSLRSKTQQTSTFNFFDRYHWSIFNRGLN